MLSNPEGVDPNPLGMKVVRNKELDAKCMDYEIDKIFYDLVHDLENLTETERRITEIHNQRMKGRTSLH
jgi:hypothetical protein